MDGIDAWRKWRTWMRAVYADDTVRSYAGNAHRFLAETGSWPLGRYTEHDCARFFEDCAPRGRPKYEYAKALRSLFSWAERHGLVEADPMEHIQMRKPRRKRSPVTLTFEELVRLLVAAYFKIGERQAWALLLVYSLGIRRKEAAGLRWSHIRDGEDGPVIEIHETKGDGERDPLPLSALALECLGRLRALPIPAQATRGEDYILRVKPQTVTDWVRRAGRWAELHPRKIGAHRLRATLATRLLRAGVDIEIVQQILGHLRLESTAYYLGKANEVAVRAGLEKAA